MCSPGVSGGPSTEELAWIGLDWIGLGWVGLGWVGLARIGLRCNQLIYFTSLHFNPAVACSSMLSEAQATTNSSWSSTPSLFVSKRAMKACGRR